MKNFTTTELNTAITNSLNAQDIISEMIICAIKGQLEHGNCAMLGRVYTSMLHTNIKVKNPKMFGTITSVITKYSAILLQKENGEYLLDDNKDIIAKKNESKIVRIAKEKDIKENEVLPMMLKEFEEFLNSRDFDESEGEKPSIFQAERKEQLSDEEKEAQKIERQEKAREAFQNGGKDKAATKFKDMGISFEEALDTLMKAYGKTSQDAMDLFAA